MPTPWPGPSVRDDGRGGRVGGDGDALGDAAVPGAARPSSSGGSRVGAYVFDQRATTFAQLDHPSLDVLETFASFEEMLAFLLGRALTI
ncbi:hypothetical protein D3C83_88670 [compost metagenome]